jgi:hypothetical protein
MERNVMKTSGKWLVLLVAATCVFTGAQTGYAAGPCAFACESGCGGDFGATWSGTASECLQECVNACESIVCNGPNNPVTVCTLNGENVLPTGACCGGGEGICVDGVTEADCTSIWGGFYVGDGTDCGGWAGLLMGCGACCDKATGVCNFVTGHGSPGVCDGAQQNFSVGDPCTEINCEAAAATGACCNRDPFGTCTDGLTRAECNCPRCEWTELALCGDVTCSREPIPTVSQWGLLVLTLSLLTGAKLRFGRHPAPEPR